MAKMEWATGGVETLGSTTGRSQGKGEDPMGDANREHKINKALGRYWKALIDYWLLRKEYELHHKTLEPIAIQCAIDAMHYMQDYLNKLRRQLVDLGVNEEDIRHPPFFPLG
jgi:hypothetical protein